ncbi:MAG: hypothetical protein LBT70_02230 [Holosporaceae bacterium]|jgi:hypothetical protein|nr:hypothetical protein [Holosporaceae bacterium]
MNIHSRASIEEDQTGGKIFFNASAELSFEEANKNPAIYSRLTACQATHQEKIPEAREKSV